MSLALVKSQNRKNMFRKYFSGAVVITVITLVLIYWIKEVYIPHNNRQQAKVDLKQLTATGALRNFDIIFQTSNSSQSRAIQLATHSAYSHCGVVHWQGNRCFVWEACNGVTETAVEKFIAKGKGAHFVLKRLKERGPLDSAEADLKMEQCFAVYKGRPYDLYFGWGDDKLYCSELVWKLYKQAAGIELGQLHQLKDFDLSNPIVQFKMSQRYGFKIPLQETVISPVDIFNSNLLTTVVEM